MYNILKYSTTKRTPFFINKGFKADILLKIRKYEELIPHTVIKMEEIYELQNKLWRDLVFFNKTIKKFINNKRVWGLTLKKKNKVYLLQRTPNIKIIFIQIIRLSNKLNFAKLKLFKILQVLGLITYKLDLPDSMKITRIKHVSVLKPVDSEAPLMEDMLDINVMITAECVI